MVDVVLHTVGRDAELCLACEHAIPEVIQVLELALGVSLWASHCSVSDSRIALVGLVNTKPMYPYGNGDCSRSTLHAGNEKPPHRYRRGDLGANDYQITTRSPGAM